MAEEFDRCGVIELNERRANQTDEIGLKDGVGVY